MLSTTWESTALFEEDGDQPLRASTLADLGYILHERNAEDESRDVFRKALQIAIPIQAVPIVLNALVGMAKLYAKEGMTAQAFEMASYTREHPSSHWQTKERADKLYQELKKQLTSEQIETARSRARSFTWKDIEQELMWPSR
jgi:hypothetical protein